MTFREWRFWFNKTPWIYKWFLVFILLRPITDNFYFLKDINPLLSPLYWIGFLTFLLSLYVISFRRPAAFLIQDQIIIFWSLIGVLSALLVFFSLINTKPVPAISLFMKLTYPFYIYFFLRTFIKSDIDLKGILKTFQFACLVVLGFFLYELVRGPLKEVTITRGSVERISGYYADVVEYAIYLLGGFLVTCYFYLKSNTRSRQVSQLIMFFVFIICIVALTRINHVASYAIFFALTITFAYYLFRIRISAFIIIGIIGFIIIQTKGEQIFKASIEPLIEKDLEVIQGEREEGALLHGRVNRWRWMFSEYYATPLITRFIGITASDYPKKVMFIAIVPHNDYLRILFFTGFIGLFLYILFIFRFALKIKNLKSEESFLGLGALLILSLLSISALPTLYSPLMNLIFSIIAFTVYPKYQISESKSKKN